MKKLSLTLSAMLVVFTGCGGGVNVIDEVGNLSTTGNDINISEGKDAHLIDRSVRTLSQPLHEVLEASTVRVMIGDNGWGSGFFVGEGGYIVTNNHVIAGESEIRIDMQGEPTLVHAQLVAQAECADLAVLKLTDSIIASPGNGNALTWLDYRVDQTLLVGSAGFPSTTSVSSGEPSYIYGDPSYTYSQGSVQTVPTQTNTAWASTKAFYHGALISQGNSGGPLVEISTGKVVGVNYAGNDETHRQLAISGLEAKKYVDRMIKGESIFSIGIEPKVMFSGKGVILGVEVQAVTPGKQAEAIGIKAGDHIYALGGEYLWQQSNMSDKEISRISSLDKYCSVLRSNNPNPNEIYPEGTPVNITILRHSQDEGDVLCTGQINGKSLTLKDDKNTVCPDAEPFKYKTNRSLSSKVPSLI